MTRIQATRANTLDITNYIDKDMWVKVHIASLVGNFYYVKLMNRHISSYFGDCVYANILYYADLENAGRGLFQDTNLLLNRRQVISLDNIRICTPLECYTTDEIIEMLGRRE